MMEKCVLDDFGLILNPETQKKLCKASFPHEVSGKKWRKDSRTYVLRLAELLGLKVLDNFAGIASIVSSDGKDASHGRVGYFGDRVVYCPVSRYPSLFSQAYSSMDEIRDEFKNKLGKYLPDEFDYTLYHLEGCYAKEHETHPDSDFWD